MTYEDLINIDEIGSKREYFKEERGDITFYCKVCEKIVEVDRPDSRGFLFICKKCSGKDISIGTNEGIRERYKK